MLLSISIVFYPVTDRQRQTEKNGAELVVMLLMNGVCAGYGCGGTNDGSFGVVAGDVGYVVMV